jgi:hypothetical protein
MTEPTAKPPARPTFTVRLRPNPGVNATIALRAALKVLLRRFGFRALEVVQETEKDGET